MVAVILLLPLSLGCYWLWNSIKEMGYESCVLSVESAIGQALESAEFNQRIVLTDKWRTLDEEEERLVFNKFVSIGRRFDCKQFPEYEDGSAIVGDHGRIKAKRDANRIIVQIEDDEGHARWTHFDN